MANENVPAYIGICKTCKGINGCIVDDGTDSKGVARFLFDVVKRCHAVERKTVGYVRTTAGDNWCTCHKKAKRDRSEQVEAAL